jgi:hypothetical protein
MIYLQRLPFPYEVTSSTPWGEIERIGAPMETILQSCRVFAAEHGIKDNGSIVEGIAPL